MHVFNFSTLIAASLLVGTVFANPVDLGNAAITDSVAVDRDPSKPIHWLDGRSNAELTDLERLKKVQWESLPAIPPPQNETALKAARETFIKAAKGTVFESILFQNATKSATGGTVSGDVSTQSVRCETSSGSPYTADILAGARWLAVNRSNKLCIMGEHEHCTNMVTWGSSGGGMCGWPKRDQITCGDVAWYLNKIADGCKSNEGKSGGKYTLGSYQNQEWPWVVQAYRS